MKRILTIVFASSVMLTLAGCGIGDDIAPKDFTAKVNVKTDGAYDLSYDGTVSYLPMMEKLAVGDQDPNAEKAEADDFVTKLSETKDISNVSYVGNGVFKLTYRKIGNLNEDVIADAGQKPLLEMTESPDGKLFVKFLSLTPEAKLPAKALPITGSIEVITDLPVESVTAAPTHDSKTLSYTWKVSGIKSEMPGMVLLWKRKETPVPPTGVTPLVQAKTPPTPGK